MRDKQFYFSFGFMIAILFMIMAVSCSEPLGANGSSCGEAEWNPCYVKIVD